MRDNQISDLIQLAVKNENFIDYKLDIHGKSGPGDGYMGKITFVTVTGKTKTQETKTLNLAIKSSTENQIFRNQVPIKLLFEQEIYIYDKVIPTFKKFQQEMGFRSPVLESLPTCYTTQRGENEVLVLENLKNRGFDLWDRTVPMDMGHIKTLLKAYAEWHAFSLALRWKNPENCQELVKNYVNMWSYHIHQVEIEPVFFQYHEEVRKFWEKDEKDIASLKFSKDTINYILHKLIAEDPEYHVISHCDGWTNNFMFRLEQKSQKPVEASIIDWQLSGLSSPVLDLSYFIYTCVDTQEHADVKELLKIYYASLSSSLYQLKCDPSEVLSFNTLVQQWKKFSCYGLLFGTFILRFSLCESGDAPDFVEGIPKGKNLLKILISTFRIEKCIISALEIICYIM
ncbi:hypothetical protein Zmor_023707 [Zophobas morio]|uniref:CHK kinase-like domain-containing protein n=1 Tax=Zophobas morio TaxID=2755281 RepID=A0AA38M6N6_9CUCU|nr:hypothetical protein Zmor_023707 [Zophobas morio]